MGAGERALRDVLVVGSGAGGAPLALALSRAGLDVLVLEKGPRYSREDFRQDELFLSMHPGFFVPKPDEEPHILVDHGAPARPPEVTTLGWIACCVGGGTTRMGASLYRFHPDDFRLRSRLGTFEEVEDWPYTYDDLEPYYSRAEWSIGVSGAGGKNPYAGRRSRPYPMPPLESHPLAAWLDRACASLGLHAYPTPRAINSRPYGGRPACAYCDYCAGWGCPVGARGGTQETLLARAEGTGRCEVRARAMVREITIGPDGRATGCIYVDEHGAEHEVRARLVCICCSAVESARLLLLSKSPLFPDGLANASGLVGRHLQFHSGSAGRARFDVGRHPEKALSDRNSFLGRSVMDFYFLPPDAMEFGKGGLLRFDLSRPSPIATARRIARSDGDRLVWGEGLVRRLREHFHETREVEFEVFHDFIPSRKTYVELDPEVTDRWGLPVARIHLDRVEHHEAAGRWVTDRGFEILDEMGADQMLPRGAGYVADVMAHGTCRAGEDPARSVVNPFCQTHDVPNLFIADGSFMPTSGGAPSTLTILANSFRTADYILDRARSGDLQRSGAMQRA